MPERRPQQQQGFEESAEDHHAPVGNVVWPSIGGGRWGGRLVPCIHCGSNTILVVGEPTICLKRAITGVCSRDP